MRTTSTTDLAHRLRPVLTRVVTMRSGRIVSDVPAAEQGLALAEHCHDGPVPLGEISRLDHERTPLLDPTSNGPGLEL